MKKINIPTTFYAYNTTTDLPLEIQNLMQKAANIRQQAYAPYSKFQVGAAILLKNGEVVLGANQENAAYPSGLCAERTAVFAAGANFPNQEIVAICISASSTIKDTLEPIPPCGACRQSLLEYENKQAKPIPIYFMGKSGQIMQSPSIKNLLPFVFKEDSL